MAERAREILKLREAVIAVVRAGVCARVDRDMYNDAFDSAVAVIIEDQETHGDILMSRMVKLTKSALYREIRFRSGEDRIRRGEWVSRKRESWIPSEVGNMTDRQRKMYELRKTGLKFAEVARRSGVTESTVRSVMFRIRKKFTQQIEKEAQIRKVLYESAANYSQK